MTISINYKFQNDESSLSQHETMIDAIRWLQNNKKEDFEYVSLTDGKGNQVVGYSKIINTYMFSRDLYCGDEDCIHPETKPGIGGGCHCTTCPAWACF